MNDKERRDLAREVQEYADSLDDYVTIDDIYMSLTAFATEIREGLWG